MRRFFPAAVIVALVGAIVAVVVIGGGDEEGGLGPKQPSVEQQVSPADELPPRVRELLGRKLDQVGVAECGTSRRPVRRGSLPSATGGCIIGLRRGGRPTVIFVARIRGKWRQTAITHSCRLSKKTARGSTKTAIDPTLICPHTTARGPVVRNGELAGRLFAKPASVDPGDRVGVAVKNAGSVPLYYGLPLRVQRKTGGGWESAKEAVYGPGPVAYRLPLFSLPPGRTAGPHHNDTTFDGVSLPRTLEPGKYRLVKQVSGDGRSLGPPRAELVAGFRVR